jgi:hypothetical protein
MNVIESMLSSGNGAAVQQLGSQFGLDSSKVSSVLSAVAPVLAHGLKEKLSADPTGGGLLSSLTNGSLAKYADDPSTLSSPEAVQQGQSILGSLFGGGSALENVISAVAGKSGVSSGVIQSMLPVLASLVMGFLSKQAAGGNTSQLMNSLNALSGEHAGFLSSLKTAAGKIFG